MTDVPDSSALPSDPVPAEKQADLEPTETEQAPPKPAERSEVRALRRAKEGEVPVEGKVIGWNRGGLHVVVDGVTAFCPRSEIELGLPKKLESYRDRVLPFLVLRVQKRGRRVVLSHKLLLQKERDHHLQELGEKQSRGEEIRGKVSSLTDFGAFVDLGGVQGLVHVSEISRTRVDHPSEILTIGQEVKVKILKVGDEGKRVSLSMKALEPDPWDEIEARFPTGKVVTGTVERTEDFGAFVEIAPGVTGLLPTSNMALPREASPTRVYHAGKRISVQVLTVDRRKRRIALALEGSQVEGTRADLESFRRQQKTSDGSFHAMAAAFERARRTRLD
jgi:small subunit ribosomal protein S1